MQRCAFGQLTDRQKTPVILRIKFLIQGALNLALKQVFEKINSSVTLSTFSEAPEIPLKQKLN